MLVCWLFGWLVRRRSMCHDILKGWGSYILCSYRRTCLYLIIHLDIVNNWGWPGGIRIYVFRSLSLINIHHINNQASNTHTHKSHNHSHTNKLCMHINIHYSPMFLQTQTFMLITLPLDQLPGKFELHRNNFSLQQLIS